MPTDDIGPFFEEALRLARELGYSCRTQRGNVCLAKRPNYEGKSEFVVGFYIEASSAKSGMNVGLWSEKEANSASWDCQARGHLGRVI